MSAPDILKPCKFDWAEEVEAEEEAKQMDLLLKRSTFNWAEDVEEEEEQKLLEQARTCLDQSEDLQASGQGEYSDQPVSVVADDSVIDGAFEGAYEAGYEELFDETPYLMSYDPVPGSWGQLVSCAWVSTPIIGTVEKFLVYSKGMTTKSPFLILTDEMGVSYYLNDPNDGPTDCEELTQPEPLVEHCRYSSYPRQYAYGIDSDLETIIEAEIESDCTDLRANSPNTDYDSSEPDPYNEIEVVPLPYKRPEPPTPQMAVRVQDADVLSEEEATCEFAKVIDEGIENLRVYVGLLETEMIELETAGEQSLQIQAAAIERLEGQAALHEIEMAKQRSAADEQVEDLSDTLAEVRSHVDSMADELTKLRHDIATATLAQARAEIEAETLREKIVQQNTIIATTTLAQARAEIEAQTLQEKIVQQNTIIATLKMQNEELEAFAAAEIFNDETAEKDDGTVGTTEAVEKLADSEPGLAENIIDDTTGCLDDFDESLGSLFEEPVEDMLEGSALDMARHTDINADSMANACHNDTETILEECGADVPAGGKLQLGEVAVNQREECTTAIDHTPDLSASTTEAEEATTSTGTEESDSGSDDSSTFKSELSSSPVCGSVGHIGLRSSKHQSPKIAMQGSTGGGAIHFGPFRLHTLSPLEPIVTQVHVRKCSAATTDSGIDVCSNAEMGKPQSPASLEDEHVQLEDIVGLERFHCEERGVVRAQHENTSAVIQMQMPQARVVVTQERAAPVQPPPNMALHWAAFLLETLLVHDDALSQCELPDQRPAPHSIEIDGLGTEGEVASPRNVNEYEALKAHDLRAPRDHQYHSPDTTELSVGSRSGVDGPGERGSELLPEFEETRAATKSKDTSAQQLFRKVRQFLWFSPSSQ
jgi:hypothetical protein